MTLKNLFQARKLKKIDAMKTVINYNVDQLVKVDHEVREQEQARKA